MDRLVLDLVDPEKKLSDEELDLLASYVSGPLYRLVSRVYRIELHNLVASMLGPVDETELVRIQGAMKGLNLAINRPRFIVDAWNQEKTKRERGHAHDDLVKTNPRTQ